MCYSQLQVEANGGKVSLLRGEEQSVDGIIFREAQEFRAYPKILVTQNRKILSTHNRTGMSLPEKLDGVKNQDNKNGIKVKSRKYQIMLNGRRDTVCRRSRSLETFKIRLDRTLSNLI